MKIAAGIVTFNPDTERLERNLSAISNQVECIFVYDNASDNSKQIKNLIANYESASLILSSHNGGMSVALNRLALRASSLGFTHILYLDQDSVSTNGMVEALALHMLENEQVAIANAWQKDINGKIGERRPDKPVFARRAITSGSLVDLSALETVGGYDERLFVDWVDFDFCDMLLLNGYKILTCSDATLLHDLGENKEFAFNIPIRSNDGTRKTMPVYRYNYPEFRIRDQARSRAIVIRKYSGTKIGRFERVTFLKDLMLSILAEKRPIALLTTTIQGYREGQRVVRETGAKSPYANKPKENNEHVDPDGNKAS